MKPIAATPLGQVLELAKRESASIDTAGPSLEERTRQFTEQYKEWFDEQNERFDKYGLWCDELRTW